MPVLDTIGLLDKKIEVDEDGCLKNIDDWDDSVARALAKRMELGELTADKIEMLNFIRGYYKKYAFSPILRAVC